MARGPLWRPSRRGVLRAGAAGAAGLVGAGLPRPARASISAADRRFLIVFAIGGWDTSYALWPFFDYEGVDVDSGLAPASENGHSFVEADTSSDVRSFYEDWGSQTCALHGFEIPSITHDRCRRLLFTGGTSTQADDFDNPPISGAAVNTTPFDDGTCTRQFRAVNLRPFGSTRTIYEILAENAGGSAAQNQAASQAAQAVFRQWVPLCRIPAATAQSWYASGLRSVIVQVRSNAALGAPFTGDNVARGGRNHFALRAGYGTGTTPSGVSIFALGRLPIHNGAAGNSTTEFFLTRVPPGNAGRTLSLDFYDVADAAGSADFEVVPPTGFGANFNDCTFNRFEGNNDGSNSNVGLGSASVDPSNGCRLNGITNAQYNGRLAEVRVRVPTGYTCDLTMALDCWIKVRVTYNTGGGKVFDHTVWDAGVVGEPVRLIE